MAGNCRSQNARANMPWGSAKITELEVITMRELRWIGRLPYSALCKMFGRSHNAVWCACNGDTWKHVAMPWEKTA